MNNPIKSTSYAWIVVALLWIVALLNYLDRLMLTSMRTSIVDDITMSEAQFGLLTTAFLWSYGLLSPLGGFLADRFSRRWVIIGSLFVWSGVIWWTGHVHSFSEMVIARTLMGVSEAFYLPAALALVVDYHRGRTRSLATGLHISGLYVGIVLGGMSGYIADYYGWRLAFQLCGMIGIGYAILLIFCLRDATAAPSPTDSSFEDAEEDNVRLIQSLRSLLSNPSFLFLLLSFCLYSIANWSIYGWMPTFLMERFSLSQGDSGLMATLWVQAAAFLAILVGGLWADRWAQRNLRSRLYVPSLGYCIGGPLLLVVAVTTSPAWAVGGLIVVGIMKGFADSNIMPILCQITSRRHRATGFGVMNFFSTLVAGAVTYAAGMLRDENGELSSVFQFSAISLVVAGLLLLCIQPRKEGEST